MALRRLKREAVAGDMAVRDGVPAAVGDSDAGVFAGGPERDFDGCDLIRRDVCLAPGEGEALAALPFGDAADLEDLAGGKRGDQAFAVLETQRAVAARGELEKGAGAPGYSNIVRTRIKFLFRCGRNVDGDEDSAHLRFFSICVLKVVSWAAQIFSVSASQSLRSVMPPSFRV